MPSLSIPAARPTGLSISSPSTRLRLTAKRPANIRRSKAGGNREICRKTKWVLARHPAGKKRPENRGVEAHFPMQNVLKISPRISLNISRAHDFSYGIKSFAQRHRHEFRIRLLAQFFLSFLQASLGSLKASLMSRIDGGEHRGVNARFPRALFTISATSSSIPSPVRQDIGTNGELPR